MTPLMSVEEMDVSKGVLLSCLVLILFSLICKMYTNMVISTSIETIFYDAFTGIVSC